MLSSFFLLPLAALSVSSHVIHARDNATAGADDFITFDPVPIYEQGPKIGKEGYVIEQFGDGCYMVTDGSYQSLVVVSDKGTIVVDNPPSLGPKLLYAIGNLTSQPVTHVIYSHSHTDHIGGVALFPSTAQTIAHKETDEQLLEAPDKNRPRPKKTFKKDYKLKVGNQTLQLSYKGENHVRGNIFIYVPKPKVLMVVDIIFPGWTPFARLGQVKNVPGFVRAHDQILDYDFKAYVGGHIWRSGNRTDVEVQKEYMTDLIRVCNDTLSLSATDDPFLSGFKILNGSYTKNPGNGWAFFKTYNDRTASYAAKKMNEKWRSRLPGSDVFQEGNAETMIESLRIDYGFLGPFGLH